MNRVLYLVILRIYKTGRLLMYFFLKFRALSLLNAPSAYRRPFIMSLFLSCISFVLPRS